MFRNTTLFGISMVPRRNRRILVLAVYLFLVLMIVFGMWRQDGYFFGFTGLPFVILTLLLTRYTFGKLVPNFTYNYEALEQVDISMPEEYGIASDTPVPMRAPAAAPDPDERDIAVRNAVHFSSFRALSIYLLLAWIEIAVAGDPRLHLERAAHLVAVYSIFAGVVLAFTLPQALVLWNETGLIAEQE